MSADDRYLSFCARRNRTATLAELRSSLAVNSERLVSMSTMSQRLHERGLYARRSDICISLTLRHKLECLQWACQHVHWARYQWRAVPFTDGSRFSLESHSRRIFIWRELFSSMTHS
ncbi:transposable element Tcb2 transposase [Trichonephila clavipes]|uniref:Transposable element Tcb2 transposase n=1 Tax=Trichonephila clavipes TaxID=2585209 RepID=A0A8X6VCH3_TRICX|nr:transposable element Tcb2 transposase [Trichonephila clavipes]